MNIEGTRVEENVISHDGRIKLSTIVNKRICETLYEMRSYYPDTILCEETVDTMIDDLMTIWFVKSFGNNKEDNIIAFGYCIKTYIFSRLTFYHNCQVTMLLSFSFSNFIFIFISNI